MPPSRRASSSSSSRSRSRVPAPGYCSGSRCAAARGPRWSMADAGTGATGADDAGVVITTHNALPWIEQCLASVEGVETVVVDNDSSDDTVAFVRERFPAVTVIEQ